MSKFSSKARGFSLVELVIVVVIIGVIAAIAVPRISRGARGAGDAAAKGSLSSLRNAIDMYAAEHGGSFPDGADQAAVETKLLEKTDGTGVVNGDATKNIYGPYLRTGFPPLPVCANRGKSTIKLVTGTKMKSQAAGKMGYNTSEVGDLVVEAL